MISKYQYCLYDNNIITDIFKRLNFSETVKKSSYVENYTIKDKDIPESLSTILYNNPRYNYYILLLNNIQNIFEEWPISYSLFVEFLEKKYATSSIVINPNFILDINFKNITHIGNSNGLKIKIKNYDKQLCKLITENKITQNQKNLLINNIILYNNDNILKQIPEQQVRIILDDKFSVHHFQNNNEIISAFDIINESGISYLTRYAQDPDGNFDTSVVTNYSYEININDDKRNVLLFRPEIVNNITTEINKLYKGIKNTSNILELPSSILTSVIE